MSADKQPSETPILIKIGKHFIPEKNIRSFARSGKATRISMIDGDDILVDLDYDKVAELMGGKKKK
jgi:hypothetical protein